MKVIICDDQAIVRDGLEMLLKLEPDIDVVGIAEDGLPVVAPLRNVVRITYRNRT